MKDLGLRLINIGEGSFIFNAYLETIDCGDEELNYMSKSELNAILKTQIDNENYEGADRVSKVIEKRFGTNSKQQS